MSLPLDQLLDLLPEPLATFLRHNALHPSSPLQVLARGLNITITTMAYPFMASALAPVADVFAELKSAYPEIFGLALFTIFLSVFLIAMTLVRRLIMWWTRVVFNLFLLGLIVVVAAAVWEKGVFDSLKLLVVLGSWVAGWCAGVGRHFWNEWERYARQAEEERRRWGS
jgi:hypothetical protein